jgi:hypothetical protein
MNSQATHRHDTRPTTPADHTPLVSEAPRQSVSGAPPLPTLATDRTHSALRTLRRAVLRYSAALTTEHRHRTSYTLHSAKTTCDSTRCRRESTHDESTTQSRRARMWRQYNALAKPQVSTHESPIAHVGSPKHRTQIPHHFKHHSSATDFFRFEVRCTYTPP